MNTHKIVRLPISSNLNELIPFCLFAFIHFQHRTSSAALFYSTYSRMALLLCKSRESSLLYFLSLSLFFPTFPLNTHFYSVGSIMLTIIHIKKYSGRLFSLSLFCQWLPFTFIRLFVSCMKKEKSYRFSKFFNHKNNVTYTMVINYFIRHLCAFIMICLRCVRSLSFYLYLHPDSSTSHCFAQSACFQRSNYTFYAYKIWLNSYTVWLLLLALDYIWFALSNQGNRALMIRRVKLSLLAGLAGWLAWLNRIIRIAYALMLRIYLVLRLFIFIW